MQYTIKDNHQLDVIIPSKPNLLIESRWEKNSKQYAVIKRFRHHRTRGKSLGDNCPILYALKNIDGLHVTSDTRKIFFEYVEKCIIEHFKSSFPFDTLIIMPSKHSIVFEIADIISRHYKVHIITHYFSKATPLDVLNSIGKMNIDISIKDKIRRGVQRDMDNLSLKHIDVRYRQYVQVLTPNNIWLPILSKNILLVDDIIASGTTLKLAKELIEQNSPQINTVASFVLFSKSKN